MPLLKFHDTTPVLTVRSLSGEIEIEGREEAACGVDRGFWIAVALAYLEFLEEREVGLVPFNVLFSIFY
jgi:hypothetical protein